MREGELAALARLIQLGGQQFASDLAAIYLDDMPLRITTAQAALRVGNAATLAKAVHSMKSSSAQLGATDLAALCESVEDAAERGDIATAGTHFTALEAAYAAFAGWLSARTGVKDRPAEAVRDGGSPTGVPLLAVIEDNADNRLLLDAMLGDRFDLDEYATGGDALAAMPTRLPDLVLLDVSLPGMDGLEVLARMREDAVLCDVPVIVVTAHAMAGDRERYLAAGFDGYVPKPIVDERVLIDTIEALLSRRARRA
jgi:two-component system cell cycle response regulator DivK